MLKLVKFCYSVVDDEFSPMFQITVSFHLYLHGHLVWPDFSMFNMNTLERCFLYEKLELWSNVLESKNSEFN